MKGTICEQEKSSVYSWSKVVAQVTQASNLTRKEKYGLEKSLVARILTETTFACGCQEPERIVIANLTTFIAAVRCKAAANHKPGETIEDRIQPLLFFPGGNSQYVKACSLLLQLISLNDHFHDFCIDILNDKFNPLTGIDYEAMKRRILTRYNKINKEVKMFYHNLFREVIKAAFWAE